ncbi:cyclic-di-AMP-binding protein CbpB [Vaginisenegalia massiliensis]|uniref:cyclic-di-AMP-binding protein CbpB n=1 Tax=Vaginisenegalia massiliensis TaxID=2058294 RepID=UPI001F14A6F2|nr:cyclic-di-AMP-binding protein CbpB [Vaginisenegalia massiliensis]
MISRVIEDNICPQLENLMIPADNVANVVSTHSLNNGLLVLSQVKYSMIPVLTPKSTIIGLVGMPQIINKVTTLNGFDMSLLDHHSIEELDLYPVVKVTLDTNLEVLIKHLIDHNFLCVVDPERDDLFLGIITRKAIMKRLNFFIHQISKDEKLNNLLANLSK